MGTSLAPARRSGCGGSAENYFTFKGPKQPGAVKIRTELEIPLPGGDDAAQNYVELLLQLGYRPVAVVKKRRESYSLARDGLNVTVCLDDAAGGPLAEVEVLAEQAQADHASGVLSRLAADLGATGRAGSYLNLLLTARAGDARRDPVVVPPSPIARERPRPGGAGSPSGWCRRWGRLHEGHASLIRAARSRDDFVAVSMFVNPTQFGPTEDLSRYPRPFLDDVRLCAAHGVDLVYHPTPEEMYPEGFRSFVEVTGLQDVLEGAARPGHFRGVATVVLKLFNQVGPDRAYFGQKDAQQVRVVRQMVRDLDVPVEVVVCPTVREPDGLALSSRNRYLDAGRRGGAAVLYRALRAADALYRGGERDPAALERALRDTIAAESDARLDYAAAVDPDSFRPPSSPDRPLLLVLAVRFGDTRLIDNLVLG
ncbi:MAG: pantoate--beta-alanine ligase [Gemmataceae bacterium]